MYLSAVDRQHVGCVALRSVSSLYDYMTVQLDPGLLTFWRIKSCEAVILPHGSNPDLAAAEADAVAVSNLMMMPPALDEGGRGLLPWMVLPLLLVVHVVQAVGPQSLLYYSGSDGHIASTVHQYHFKLSMQACEPKVCSDTANLKGAPIRQMQTPPHPSCKYWPGKLTNGAAT